MKFNGATFNKAQQDQLKKKVGAEIDDVIKNVEDVDARMLNYMGDWVTGNEYKENDVVTWAHDGHLYEVIKAHTSSATLDPDNPEYYKAMTARKYASHTFSNRTEVYTFLNSTQLEKVKYIVISSATGSFTLMPQGATNIYSTTAISTTDGAIRQVFCSIYSQYTLAFYIDTDKDGVRTIHQIAEITNYAVYTEV